ncbi:MAG: VCBS repeat-containing protein [Pirellulaceae bacterium]
MRHVIQCCVILVLIVDLLAAADRPWTRHTIDDGSRGADGVRVGDVNQDGRLDLVTGWEEGGQIRVCLQPPTERARMPWETILVGKVRSPEDAVFADVNGDGWLDVVSCCEGKQQAIFFHLHPGSAAMLSAANWKTELLAASKGSTRWMFCEPLPDGRLIFGSKEPHAQIAIWNPRQANSLRQLRRCGWIMSLRQIDVDNDGDSDVVYSDRKGNARGVGWLENPGDATESWTDHAIGGQQDEVMFLDLVQSNADLRIVCNTKVGILDMRPADSLTDPWPTTRIPHPPGVGSGKGIALCDVNRDGQLDLVCTCEHAEQKIGVYWLKKIDAAKLSPRDGQGWKMHDISGTTMGVKFDRIHIMDVDDDGDDDVITCEERDNLGVIWYENPGE